MRIEAGLTRCGVRERVAFDRSAAFLQQEDAGLQILAQGRDRKGAVCTYARRRK